MTFQEIPQTPPQIVDESLGDGIVVIDNFLPPEDFYNFAQSAMTQNAYLPCDFTANRMENDGSINMCGDVLIPVDKKKIHEVMWQSALYARHDSHVTFSNFYLLKEDDINKILKALDVKKLWMMRINCTAGQYEPYKGAFHQDFSSPIMKENVETAILYLNTNNGGTQFHDEKGPIVKSKSNRLVKFPTKHFHAGIWSTDAKLRHVLNINYETN